MYGLVNHPVRTTDGRHARAGDEEMHRDPGKMPMST